MSNCHTPIVFSCSGCSNLARIAHEIAETLDSDGVAEMSSILGVIGKVAPIANIAHSGRQIIAIDGCQFSCVKAGLAACNLSAQYYFKLSEFGIEKRLIGNGTLAEMMIAMKNIYDTLHQDGVYIPKPLGDAVSELS